MTDKYLPLEAVDDLLFGFLKSTSVYLEEDSRVRANSCFDLLMNLASMHPEKQVGAYLITQIKQIEGIE